jgi:hypothetical protein
MLQIKKICNKCGLEKPIELFVVRKRNKDGHDPICLECKRLKDMDHYYSNKERRDKIRENSKKWAAENPDKIKIYGKKLAARKKEFNKNKPRKIYIKTCPITGEIFVSTSPFSQYSRNGKLEMERNRSKNYKEKLTEHYIVGALVSGFGISRSEIRSNPQLIEIKRKSILLHRYLLTIKKHNHDASKQQVAICDSSSNN